MVHWEGGPDGVSTDSPLYWLGRLLYIEPCFFYPFGSWTLDHGRDNKTIVNYLLQEGAVSYIVLVKKYIYQTWRTTDVPATRSPIKMLILFHDGHACIRTGSPPRQVHHTLQYIHHAQTKHKAHMGNEGSKSGKRQVQARRPISQEFHLVPWTFAWWACPTPLAAPRPAKPEPWRALAYIRQ